MDLSDVRNISVMGSGIMGHGIGQTFALGGYEVTLNDLNDELLNKAVLQIKKNLETFVEFGITTSEAAQKALSRIRIETDSRSAVKHADIVVEALPEVMDL